MTEQEIRSQAYEECAKIAESFQEFAVHRPGCFEIAKEIRARMPKIEGVSK